MNDVRTESFLMCNCRCDPLCVSPYRKENHKISWMFFLDQWFRRVLLQVSNHQVAFNSVPNMFMVQTRGNQTKAMYYYYHTVQKLLTWAEYDQLKVLVSTTWICAELLAFDWKHNPWLWPQKIREVFPDKSICFTILTMHHWTASCVFLFAFWSDLRNIYRLIGCDPPVEKHCD